MQLRECSSCGSESGRKVYCKNLCKSCYNRVCMYGDPTPRRQLAPSFEERFWAKVRKTTKCWIWDGVINRKGYGEVSHPYSPYSRMAHRTAWIILRGSIPGTLQLDHLCLNKACVNPDHLEPVTNQINMQRAKAHRTHCRRGHIYDSANTFYRLDGGRGCRTCREASRKQFHMRNPNYYSKGLSIVIDSCRIGSRV